MCAKAGSSPEISNYGDSDFILVSAFNLLSPCACWQHRLAKPTVPGPAAAVPPAALGVLSADCNVANGMGYNVQHAVCPNVFF